MSESHDRLSVSRLVSLLRDVVEENFVQVLVEGEVSNFASPASGHLYFTLKDENAQIKCAMFRPQARLVKFRPENGMQLICTGRVSVYPQRGELQLVAETLEPCGVGGLQVAFEQLKTRLAAEGLFDQDLKRPIPPFPATIGVVTSPDGAAIHDILNVLRRRQAGVKVILAPVRVQGESAAAEIARAIEDLNRHGSADVLIVGRGGGSLEDLWSFNEECVARAIRGSAIPVISAVGHEVDFTIADFASDLRAPTPSAAAELVVKNRMELESHLDHLLMRLRSRMDGVVRLLEHRVEGLRRRLRSPQEQLAIWRHRHRDLEHRLTMAMNTRLTAGEHRLGTLSSRLDALSPLRVLARGYALALRKKNGRSVLDASELERGELLQVRFASGQALVTVEETTE